MAKKPGIFNTTLDDEEQQKTIDLAKEYCTMPSEFKLHIKFISHKEKPIQFLNKYVADYLLLYFKNGSYEVIPRNVFGLALKNYLGARFLKVHSWAVLPGSLSNNIPILGDPAWMRARSSKTSLYDTYHDSISRQNDHGTV